uniref:Ribonuclease H protein At1g65750 family n=1 Tax=Cajanus cajan TaxID=3821 RepID=A0A151SH20_CAJCA|nr:Putative ribonuclease H protein At1g65750 family [Cajanus cajan]
MQRGFHLATWDVITQPDKFGGLGVHVACLQNTTLLGKLIWECYNNEGKLWVHLVKAKYPGDSLQECLQAKGSFFWSSLFKAFGILREGFHLQLGQGNVSIWYDRWLDASPLCLAVPYVHYQDVMLKVKDVFVQGQWRLQQLYTPITPTLSDKILSSHVSLHASLPDVVVWKDSLSTVYYAKLGYRWLLARSGRASRESWTWL